MWGLKPSVVAIVLTLTFASLRAQQGETRQSSATVHVRLVDRRGIDINGAHISLFKADRDGKDFSNRFHGNTATDIPFGTYLLGADSTGFWSGQTNVVVKQEDVQVVLELEAGTNQ